MDVLLSSSPTGHSPQQNALRRRITAACRLDESEAVSHLLAQATLDADAAERAHDLAVTIARRLRERKASGGRAGLVQGLLQEYALSSQEGVALMCLAEALLRIPDAATRDALIRDKIAHGRWREHSGNSPSFFVNAATWGLLLTGKLVATHSETSLGSALTRLIGRGGEPMIRKAVDMAMRMMGEQFVAGETVAAALRHAADLEPRGFRYSYDMLGEAALTDEDAQRYRLSYERAIDAIGKASGGRGIQDGPGISIKLSALHPRYQRAQIDRVMNELYPVVLGLARQALKYGIGLNIDAEEADRLEISLELLEKLCFEPSLQGWNGIGFVVQAYQKRCPPVIDYLVDLARRSRHRLMIRLVKGAYWDSEIKRAQVDGQAGFPVYTRKAHTDVSYLACARRLLAAPDAIYPQFATHNAHTMAAIYTMADPLVWQPGQYEFQCLHGMGEPLYEQVVGRTEDGRLGRPCRIYAPVGTHETLLAYLVRRLLENGANTSFVNRVADPSIPIESLVEDPVATVTRLARAEGAVGRPHPAIPAPRALYGAARANSTGIDLSDESTLAALDAALVASAREDWSASAVADGGAWSPVRNPADRGDVVGRVRQSSAQDVEAALGQAAAFAGTWARTTAAERAALLERAADLLQARLPVLLGLLAREAGKTYSNGIAEVREAVDFLRFYAAQARSGFDDGKHLPLGPVVCISPWNFPLAIFLGQVAAALACGNTVIAKPAEQTPLVAAEAVRLLHAAGVPAAAVQLLPGDGATVGASLVADARTQAVMFTGSTEVAHLLQRSLAGRLGGHGMPVPLIAETGGQNAMIVDSSALVEQAVADVMASAFDSAGQRCSALRVLCVQEDIADRLLHMLRGAMAEAVVGNPAWLNTDVGPVIDAQARAAIEAHIAAMQSRGRRVERLGRGEPGVLERGTYVMPTLIELESVSELQREVFGPVLHVVRYRRQDLAVLLDQVAATGYGLTLGVHTRIDETIRQVVSKARVGNIYVNRNIVGAVVGVQPFGGEGLSGTGPKAGGPFYMYRLLSRRPGSLVERALENGLAGASAEPRDAPVRHAADELLHWLEEKRDPAIAERCRPIASAAGMPGSRTLAGPTGERNVYCLHARDAILCLAGSDEYWFHELVAVLAAGCRAVSPADPRRQALLQSLPPEVQAHISLVPDWTVEGVHFDAALYHGSDAGLLHTARALAERPGPIVTLRRVFDGGRDFPVEALLLERSTSTNTAAAGGNASLMTLA